MTGLQVITHAPGPAWLRGIAFRNQPRVADHVATMKGWLAAGQLVVGGPFLDDAGGGMAIVRFDDVPSADAAAQQDSAVQAGLLVATTRPWLVGLSAVDIG